MYIPKSNMYNVYDWINRESTSNPMFTLRLSDMLKRHFNEGIVNWLYRCVCVCDLHVQLIPHRNESTVDERLAEYRRFRTHILAGRGARS